MRYTFALPIALVLAGCASSQKTTTTTTTVGATARATSPGTSPTRSSSTVLVKADFDKQVPQATNAYEVVSSMRPTWLRSRGATSFGGLAPLPKVYIGDVYHGELESLRTVNVASISEIRLLSASDATTRFGTGVDGGAIVITLIR